MFLIDDLLLAPVNGFKFILGQIQKMADQELNDDSLIKDQLLELQMRYDLEEISDEEFQDLCNRVAGLVAIRTQLEAGYRYRDLMQRDPDVVLAHAAVARSLKSPPPRMAA